MHQNQLQTITGVLGSVLANKEQYIYLNSDSTIEQVVTNAALIENAKSIACLLQKHHIKKGDRAILIYEHGLDFISAFLGCLFAGVVAVPCYPPLNDRLVNKLSSIINNSTPSCIMSSSLILKKINKLKSIKFFKGATFFNYLFEKFIPTTELSELEFNQYSWLITDSIDKNLAKQFESVPIDENDIAFLQYTSGSTSTPKGVIVTHKNLLDNIKVISENVGLHDDDRIVSWLPPYHDMGLIGSLLTPLIRQVPAYIISPIAFIKNPQLWLKSITLYQATVSPAPNFAYALCTKRINPEQVRDLNLSSWRVALNGAEPINPSVLNEFEKQFHHCGFNKKVIFPCYGLAESTLFVTGRYGIETAQPNTFKSKHKKNEVISCGYLNPEINVQIIDPETGFVIPDGHIGEVCINGASVTQGYWNNTTPKDQMFIELTHNQELKSFLKTGDLGFVLEEQLYITGRIKDLIIIRGVNYYPQDIEHSISTSFKEIKHGTCVAFSMDSSGNEGLGIIFETTDINDEQQISELFGKVKKLIIEEHQILVSAIYNVKPKSIMKTTSGKIERAANKRAVLNKEITILFSEFN